MMNTLTNYLKKGRDPGWVELFFDLAYAVLMGRLAHLLFHTHHGHLVVEDVLHFLWILMIMFMVWMLYTVYMNVYGNDSLWQTFMGFGLMVCLFAVAAMMHDIHDNAPYIAGVMGVMSLIIAALNWISRDAVPENRAYAIYKSRASLILGIISLMLIFMSSEVAYTVSIIIYPLEHLLDEVFLKRVGMTRPDGEHFVERIGIIIILLTGESFITLMNNMPEEIGFHELMPAGIMLVIIFGMFMNYFSHNERLAHGDYRRYSQVLAPNYLVMYAYTLLPVLVYHGIHQQLNLTTFKLLGIIFLLLFFIGNGLAYRMAGSAESWKNTVYTGVFPIVFSGILWMTETYSVALMAFMLIVVLTGSVVLLFNHQTKETATVS